MDSEFSWTWTQGPPETNSIMATVVTKLTEAEEAHWRGMLAQAWEEGWEAGVMDNVLFTESLKTSGAPLHDKTPNPYR